LEADSDIVFWGVAGSILLLYAQVSANPQQQLLNFHLVINFGEKRMKKRNTLILGGVAVAIALGGAIFLTNSKVLAQYQGKYPPIVQKLVDKFGLNTTEVDKVMEEVQAERGTRMQEMQATRHAEIEAKLTQAVQDGKLTEDQKTQILAKLAEMEPVQNRAGDTAGWFDLSAEERQTKMDEMRNSMEQRRADLEAWVDSLGVDLDGILGYDVFGGRGGPGGRGGFGDGQGFRGMPSQNTLSN